MARIVDALEIQLTQPVPLGRLNLGTVSSDGTARESQDGEPAVLRQLVRLIQGPDQPFVGSNRPWIVDVGTHDGSFYRTRPRLSAPGGIASSLNQRQDHSLRSKPFTATRPTSVCVNAACSDHEGTAILWIGNDGVNGTNSTLSTDTNEWFTATRSDRSVEVTVRTLTELCREHGVPARFPILLVDAERMDLEVLRASTQPCTGDLSSAPRSEKGGRQS